MHETISRCDSTKSVRNIQKIKSPQKSPVKSPKKETKFGGSLNIGDHNVPKDVLDFDKENWNDVFQVSHYAKDIFNYLKSREVNK